MTVSPGLIGDAVSDPLAFSFSSPLTKDLLDSVMSARRSMIL